MSGRARLGRTLEIDGGHGRRDHENRVSPVDGPPVIQGAVRERRERREDRAAAGGRRPEESGREPPPSRLLSPTIDWFVRLLPL